MAEETAAARGVEEYDGAEMPRDLDKTGGRGCGLPHPVLIEIARLLARTEARRLHR